MLDKFINTKEKLPSYRKDVLFWFPANRGFWVVGYLCEGDDKYGDFFQPHGGGAWYLCDGHTVWTKLPPRPKIKKEAK